MGSLSLRNRLLLAAIVWTVGLSIGVLVLSTYLMLHFPSWPRVMHGAAWAHTAAFTAVTLLLLFIGFLQLRRSLSSLDRLRARLADVHAGRDVRVTGEYPSEVQPLVDDLNALLERREQMVRRAIAKAGDLAHGLKTPLAVMSHEAERAQAEGHGAIAETIGEQIERMRRQIDYHLAHARAAASSAAPGTRSAVLESAEGLARTLQRLHAGRALNIVIDVPADQAVRGQREDLDEMLGNLLDNACKWAKSRVTVSSSAHQNAITITVDDDGPGLAPGMREAVLQRGVRADEAAPGSGFGLAIVRDLAEIYGGSISLDRSSDGGVRASLVLPG
jgi:signal transduction histidine kinase